MTYRTSIRFKEMPTSISPFREKVNSLIKKYERTGRKWYRVTGADMPMTGHRNKAMTELLVQAVREGWDYYITETPWPGEFVEAAANYEKKYFGLDLAPEDIIPVAGAANGWKLLHYTLLDPGDEVVAIEPAHYMAGPVSYMWLFGAKVVQVPSLEDEEWDPDLDKLRSSVTEKTKMICLDNPNNPTGAIYSNKARRAIIDIAGEYDIPVISDELYRQITFDEYEAPSMALNVKDVPVIMMTSFSKFFMKPGWRIGYLGFNDPTGKLTEIKNACKRMASTYGHHQACIPCPVLVAATRALRGLTDTWWFMGNEMTIKGVLDESKEMLRNLQKNRDYSIKRMNEIKGIDVVKSKASLYMFPRVEEIGKTWKTTEDFILDLFEEEAVIFNNGEGYGNSGFGHFRTIIQDNLKVLEDIYDRIERFLTKRTQ